MVDKRLSRLKIDREDKWIAKLELILDEMLDYYSNSPVDEFIIDYIIDENDHIELVLLVNYARDVHQIVKFYPFLLLDENYELMAKAERLIEYLGAERLKQFNYFESKHMSIDEFTELIIIQKKEIVNQVINPKDEVKGDLNEEDL